MTMAAPKRRPRRRPWWPWLLLAALVIGGGAYALLRQPAQDPASLVKLSTATASLQDFRDAVTGSGSVAASASYDVKARVSGVVKSVVAVGARVTKGQVVAMLDNSTYQRALDTNNLALQKAQASLASLVASQTSNRASNGQSISQARMTLANAQADQRTTANALNAAKTLYAVGGGSQQSVLDAQSAYDKAVNAVSSAQVSLTTAQGAATSKSSSDAQDLRNAQLGVQQAQVNVQSAQQDLGYTKVYATISGIISVVNVTPGSDATQALMTILDDSSVTVPVQIDETEISKVRLGQVAEATLDAISGQTFKGKVTSIAPSATVQQNIPIFNVTVTLANPDLKLRPGMSAEANIISQDVPNAIVAPLKAVATVRRRAYVTVLGADGKTQEQRRVTTGVDDGVNVVIVNGLKDGETVVLPTRAVTTTTTTNRGGPGGFF